MLGNVFEWCHDAGSHPSASSGDEVENPEGASSGLERMLRGGSWHNSAGYARAAYGFYQPTWLRVPHVGFRPVRTLSF